MIDGASLAQLEAGVGAALARASADGLDVLGYGEISLVLGWPPGRPAWACKRLPPMTPAAADRYCEVLDRYLAELARRDVDVVETTVERIPLAGGRVAVYCVQPVLPLAALAPRLVRERPDDAPALLRRIVDTVFAVTDASTGLDAQLSNWAADGDRLRYLDITTPLLRAADGTNLLDTEVFLASLPWLLRTPARRLVVPGIVERYHRPRTVVLDLAANLVKERLDAWIPTVLDATAGRVDPPLTEAEVRRDYRSDARTWATLQALRRADRVWQRRVRRRAYPTLLPPRIAR